MVHLVDGGRPDPLADMDTVNDELAEYGGGLEEREQIVVVNKIDIPEVRAALAGAAGAAGEPRDRARRSSRRRRARVRMTSCGAWRKRSRRLARSRPAAVEVAKLRPRPLGRGFSVRREGEAFRVEGERVAAFAEMMPVEVEEGRQELWRRLGRWGVSGALRRAGAAPGDRMRLGKVELEWPG